MMMKLCPSLPPLHRKLPLIPPPVFTFASVSISVSSVILHFLAVSPSATSRFSSWHCVHLFVCDSVHVSSCERLRMREYVYIYVFVWSCSLFAVAFFLSADPKHDCVECQESSPVASKEQTSVCVCICTSHCLSICIGKFVLMCFMTVQY